jgi:hypothetical protein
LGREQLIGPGERLGSQGRHDLLGRAVRVVGDDLIHSAERVGARVDLDSVPQDEDSPLTWWQQLEGSHERQ